jgi:hypothetical protein
MKLQPSASRTELLLNCQYPFGREVPREEGVKEPARYGLAFHELMAHMLTDSKREPPATVFQRVALKWKVDETELIPHVKASFKVLDKWLRGGNPWGVNFRKGDEAVEASFALGDGVGLGATRSIANPTEDTHEYLDLKEGEVAGTIDYLSIPNHFKQPFKVVIDHKTGFGDFSSPEALPQLRTLAAMVDRLPDTPRTPVIGAILHADRQGVPTIYAEEFPALIGEYVWQELRKVVAKIGDGSLRPGAHCEYCPARPICPARDGEIIRSALEMLPRAGALIKRGADDLVSSRDLGKLHVLIKEFEKLVIPAKAEIKAAVQAGAMIERPDGKVLVLKTKTIESLSKASIERALGKLKAAKEIERLRKLGCVDVREQEEIHAED